MNDAASGFPWNRVQAARSYLLALKPWLAPIAQTTTVVPVDRPPISGEGWLVAPQSDRHGRLYLDRSFALSQPVHVLAGALEHEYAKVSRGVFSRLAWIGPDDWDEIAAPAFQLEIMDAMEREREFLSDLHIEKRLGQSRQFNLHDYEDWEVAGPPSLTEAGALSPRGLGLPEGQSAETYAQLLLEARRQAEAGDVGSTEAESSKEESDSSEGLPLGGGAGPAAPSAGTGIADAEPASDDDAVSNGRGDATDPDPDPLGLLDGDADGEGAAGPGEAEDDAGWGDFDDDSAAPAPRVRSEAEDDAGWGDADLFSRLEDIPSRQERDPRDDITRPREPARSTTQQMLDEIGGGPALDARRRDALLEPDTLAWSKSMPHHDDEFAARIAPDREGNAPAVPEMKIQEALMEAAALTARYASHPGSGVDVRNLEMAQQRLRSLGLTWEKHLSRVVSSCLTSERVRGASDLTYSVANPNQPEIGVRLMGMTDYSPSVTIIQDVSGSMSGTMTVAMDAMTELMTALVGRLQARSTWVTIANAIVDVGDAGMLTKDVRAQWAWGGGGTNLGGLIGSLMGDGVKTEWKGRRLTPPDLLVVSTDAQFHWPPSRPSRAHRLLVVVYHERHLDHLPEWVDRRTEVIVAAA